MQENKDKILHINYLPIILALVVVLFLGAFFTLRYYFSYSVIENKLENFLGVKIELTNPKTTLSPNLNLTTKAQSIEIFDKNKKTKFISITNPTISFKPLNLIFKKINIRNLSADYMQINIKRDQNGNIDLIQAIPERDWSFLEKNKESLTKLNSKIKKTELTFEDNYKIKSKTKLILNDTEAKISKKNKSLFIKQNGIIETNVNSKKQTANIDLYINSRYPLRNLKSDGLDMKIDLKNLDLYIFNDLAKKYISKDIASINGNSDILIKTDLKIQNENQNLNIIIKNPTLKLNDGKIITPYKTLTLKSNFLIDKSHIKISNLNIDAPELSIFSNGEILKPFSKNRTFNFDTEIKNTQLNNFLYLLPDNLIFYRPKGIPTLKKSNFHALLNGKINTKLFPLSIEGNLKASNVYIPGIAKPYKQNDVNATFMKNKVRIYTRVYTPDNEYVLVDGISNLDNSLYGKYIVKSTKKINLDFAQAYLVPIQQIIGFNIGPVPIMKISGYGNIDIKTQGTLNDGQIFGEFSAYDTKAKIKGIDSELTNANCKIVFDNRNLYIKEIKGKMQGADFLLSGSGNTKGEINIDTKIKNATTHNILKVFNNSIIAKPYVKYTKNIAATSGKLEADVNLKGTIKNYEDENFLTTLSPSGNISFSENKIIFNNKLGAQKITGSINFGNKQSGFIEFLINNSSKASILFSSKDSLEKISKGEMFEIKNELFSNQISSADIIKELEKAAFLNKEQKDILSKFENLNFYTKFYIKSDGKISLNEISPQNLTHSGYITGLNSKKNTNVEFNSGIIKIKNSELVFDNFAATLPQGKIKIKGSINNFLSKKPLGDLTIDLSEINITNLNNILPKANLTKSILKAGQIIFKNNDIKFNNISLDYESMPLFINAKIKDIYNSKILSCNFSTILNEITTDSIINPYLTYPLKIKGEIPLKGTFKGNSEKYLIDIIATLPRESDIYFSGANIGDTNHKREIQGKFEVNQNIATIHNFKLIKYIANQNKKINPIVALKANGQATQEKDKINYNNLQISTNAPVNVRILNLIFKKSLLKQGNFECNINLNGNSKMPVINGKIMLQDLDIPLYNTQINNISINIFNKLIEAQILAKNNHSDIKATLKAQNKLQTPYIVNKIDVESNKLDISDILSLLSPQTKKNDINIKQEITIKPEDIIIKNGSFDFKTVNYENINAQNLKGNFDYSDNIFNLKNTILDIAQGKITTEGNYNLKNTELNLNAKMEECDSNILTKDFLHIEEQIFGKMNGSIKLTAKNLNTPQGIKSVKSDVDFSINNGKMPKLGSLEYLLRAGNLLKNGLLGLSLNNIIQVLTPYKTGDFENISGIASIGNGKIENLEILSQGKNLSLYLVGSYNLLENFADIKIYGKLSQNISNALGAVGNASINQFINSITSKKDKENKNEELMENLNKIPPIEIENPEPRYFKAKVLGDINKENYIKSFNWE